MRPSEALAKHRDEVLAIIASYPVSNPRIFGSVARGEDREGSDLDMVIDAVGSFSYFDMAKLALELEGILGCPIDLGTYKSLHADAAINAASDLRPL
jgi:predicted nucleotidyltransferase